MAKYANVAVRNDIKRKLEDAESTKHNPVAWDGVRDKNEFLQQEAALKSQIKEITPPEVKSEDRDNVGNRLKQLEKVIVAGSSSLRIPPMPSNAKMQRAPAGSVGQHMDWEKTWKTHTVDTNGNLVKIDPKKGGRGAIDEWKDLRRSYHKDREESDPDIANIETIRPTDERIPLHDERLPRSYGLSSLAKDNYDTVFDDHPLTPVEAKLAELTAQIPISQADITPVPKKKRKARTINPLARRCEATLPSGEQCKQPALADKPHCFSRFHRDQLLAKASPVETPAPVEVQEAV
jgi:hypothetical protein